MLLKRQFGLFVSICFVVGFIVGTGIFFLPGRILYETGGSITLGAISWLTGGFMIAPSVLMFGFLSTKYEKIHGFVDYSEAVVGEKYGYLAGWFFAVMYQPAGYAIIAWITSGFTATLVGMTSGGDGYFSFRFFITAFFMVMVFMMNYFAPKVPVKFNVVTTVLRLIPLVLMGTVGVVVAVFFPQSGLISSGFCESLEGSLRGDFTHPGNLAYALGEEGLSALWAYTATAPSVSNTPVYFGSNVVSVFAAISATAFAFNGWQAALAFNSEVVDSKRKFPLALLAGFGIVAVVYVLYFLGIGFAIGEDMHVLMAGGGANFAEGTRLAFGNVFGAWAARFLVFFMIISGLGILNACCLAMSRAMYSLGRRKKGPLSKRTVLLDSHTDVPNNSMVMAVGISFLWFAVIYANAFYFQNFAFSLPDFYNFAFFALIIPIFVFFAYRHRELSLVKRFLLPSLAVLGAAFMHTSYWIGSFVHALVYLCVFLVLGAVGVLLHKSN